jgi:glucose/arabinose dehydrogenase
MNTDKYPAWKGNLMIGSLRFNYLNRCVIQDNKVVKQEKILINVGRLRNVKLGSDGYMYIGVENPGMVFRVNPN